MDRLRLMEPRFAQKATELTSKIHLLEKLPLILTHLDFAEVKIMVDPQTGHVTGILDFDGARVEPFGMCIFGVYEGFFGEMRDSKWKFFDQPASRDAPCQSVREILEKAFWDTLWNAVPSWMDRLELKEPVTIALEMGIVNRYLDWDGDMDPENESHMRAVSWAAGLLLDR